MSIEPSAAPKTYQDVKSTLRWYTVAASVPVALFLYFYLVPESQRKHVEELFSKLSASPIISSVGAATFMIGAFVFVSWFLIFVFEIHDKVYDRYFIRWRYFYDLDVILPTLTRPFGPHLDPQFFDTAGKHIYKFMKPYYHFVADGEHDHKLAENLILRFYEAVTKYWLTQINEVLLITAFVVNLIYFWIYRQLGVNPDRISISSFVIIICWILNRVARQFFLRPVRRATLDEIEDIHNRYIPELGQELRKIHDKFNLRWRP